MSLKRQKQFASLYGMFLIFWLLFGSANFLAMIYPVSAEAQTRQQGPPRHNNTPREDSDSFSLAWRVGALEDWRRDTIDPARESVYIRLERIEAAEAVREKVVYAFVIPVLGVMIKEIIAFVKSNIRAGSKDA